jgi:hypothetical protein
MVSPFFALTGNGLIHGDGDLPWLCLVGFGDMNFQYAVTVRGLYFVALYGFGTNEGVHEFKRYAFHSMILDAVRWLVELWNFAI